jgi:O-antigen ligase
VELPVLLLLLSTIVLRRRTASDLALDPLDPAAQFRVLCVGVALALGSTAFVSPPLPGTTPRLRLAPLPVRLYSIYALVAVAGAMISVNPILTLYRTVELAAGLFVLAGAYRAAGDEATGRLEATVYWFVVAQLCAVWIGLVVAPDQALVYKLSTTKSPFKFELEGVLPALSANIVGARAVLLALWSLARLVARQRAGRSTRSAGLLLLFGLVTLVAAQYRTGYAAFIVGATVIFGIRRRGVLVAGAVAAVAVLLLVPSGIERARPFLLRGETTKQAGELSYRVTWWREALGVWERSPVIGRGLLTASRFEVLTQSVFATTSDIHSTWVESLVGTGVVGFGLLLASFLTTAARAQRLARKRDGPILPLVLLTVLLIRSLTGNALESFSVECLLFLVVAFSLEDQAPAPVAQR